MTKKEEELALVPLVTTIAAFAVIYVVWKKVPEQELVNFIQSMGIMAPIVFVLLTLITLVVAPLGGSPLLFTGHYLFGDQVVFLTMIASYIAFVVNYWVARKLGRGAMRHVIGNKNMQKVDKFTHHYGLATLFFLRLFQSSIADFISYAAGLAKMRFIPYLVVSILASVPATILWYFISSISDNAAEFTLWTWIMTTSLTGIFLLGTWLERKWGKKS